MLVDTGGGTLVPWLRGACSQSARALRGAQQRQDGGKKAQAMARICSKDVRRREERRPGEGEGGAGSPGVRAAGTGDELRGRRRMAGEQSCVGARERHGWRGATRPILKPKPNQGDRSPGVPALLERGAHAVCGAARGFPTHPAPPPCSLFYLELKKQHHQQHERKTKPLAPRHPESARAKGDTGAGLGGRDLAALTPASARAEKFARSRTPRALGQPAGGSESARAAVVEQRSRGRSAERSARPPTSGRSWRGGAIAGRWAPARLPATPAPPPRPEV